MESTLKVLIADDSPTARQLMAHLISSTADMEVIGEACNGAQAIRLARELRPNVILMDITMPDIDGLEATREIMDATPTPIVMITANSDSSETDVAFQALRLGALSVMRKPVAPTHLDYVSQSSELINTVRAMADVRVIHHRKPEAFAHDPKVKVSGKTQHTSVDIVAITSSTGGPAALSEIFRELPADFNIPLVVVQHISPDFLPSLVEWLNTTTALKIEIAREGAVPLPGHIYFAPSSAHLRLSRSRRFELDDYTLMPYTPSGDILLKSIAANYAAHAVGVVLTGMGADGAEGLHAMHQAEAYTIAQDEATSVVFGMPQAAIALGAAQVVLPIRAIAQAIIEFSPSRRDLPEHIV